MEDSATRLWRGVKKGDLAEVSVALELGANVDSHGKSERTPLMEAAKRGQHQLISLLLIHGADINAQDKSGTTPLIHALIPDNLAIVKLLLDKGADTTIKDKSGDTALKLLAQKQLSNLIGPLVSILLFVKEQQRSTKDKDLRSIEIVVMVARLCEVVITLHKYESMKQLLKGTVGNSPHDH